jgi:hypothetical protein
MRTARDLPAAQQSGVWETVKEIFILLAGVFLMGGHPFPFGTIAFGCLFIAAAIHEWVAHRAGRPGLAAAPRLDP